jgi:hypothetical protein
MPHTFKAGDQVRYSRYSNFLDNLGLTLEHVYKIKDFSQLGLGIQIQDYTVILKELDGCFTNLANNFTLNPNIEDTILAKLEGEPLEACSIQNVDVKLLCLLLQSVRRADKAI